MTNWGLIGLGKIADVRVAPAFARPRLTICGPSAGRDAERTAAFAARHDATPAGISEILADPADQGGLHRGHNDLHAPTRWPPPPRASTSSAKSRWPARWKRARR